MNDENLIPYSERSESEARENGRKGGINSGKSRRRKKALKDCMKQLLALGVTDTEQYNELAMMGIAPEDIDNNMLVTVGLFKAAVDGDVRAYHEMRHLIGENETDLDKKIKRAQLDKLKAEAEEIRRRNDDGGGFSEEERRALADALSQSAAAVWEDTDDEN